MSWVKRGLVYAPDGSREWSRSHAQVPVVDVVDDERLRVYFGTRDEHNRTRTTFVEVSAGNPSEVLYVHHSPVLALGELGAFDECGAMPSWIVATDDAKLMYYIGWTVRNTIPYHNSVGLARSEDGIHWQRVSRGPLLDSTPDEPFFTGTSCVIVEDGVWKNWYLSCTNWQEIDGRFEPFYHIKYAESDDGVHWRRDGHVAIDYRDESEGGIVKASVVRDGELYKMWFSTRAGRDYRTNKHNSYRIGYAESRDGRDWQRRDELVDLALSESGWDSEMVCYPHVVDVAGRRLMFYNGNGFGRSGFGYAEWVE